MHEIQALGQLAADQTSVRASRQRTTTVAPRGRYDFGDGDLIGAGPQLAIQPMPIKSQMTVHSAAVPPDSLPGSALPKDTVMMPTGKMAGLGDALCPVPVAFRRGVEPEAKAQLLRPGADIRMVGGHLRRMAPHAHHVPRAPLVHDRPVLNASATSHVRSEGMTPDDRIHQRLAPATNPMLAPKVSQVVARTPMPRAATTLAPVARLSARTPMQTAAPMRAPERHYEAAPHYQTASRSLRGDGGVVGGPKIPLVPIMPVASQIRTALAPMPGSMNLRLPSGGIVSSSGGSSDTTGAPSAPACPAGTVPLPDGSGCACAAGTVPNADGTACVSAPSGGGSDAAHGPSGGVNPLVWVGLAAVLGGVYWMTQSQEH